MKERQLIETMEMKHLTSAAHGVGDELGEFVSVLARRRRERRK